MKAIDMLKTYMNNGKTITKIIIEDSAGYQIELKTNEATNVEIPDYEIVNFKVTTWWVSATGTVYIYVERDDDII